MDKLFHYAQIDNNGYVVADSYLSGEINHPLMIPIDNGFSPLGKQYVNGEWVDVPQEEVTEEETEKGSDSE